MKEKKTLEAFELTHTRYYFKPFLVAADSMLMAFHFLYIYILCTLHSNDEDYTWTILVFFGWTIEFMSNFEEVIRNIGCAVSYRLSIILVGRWLLSYCYWVIWFSNNGIQASEPSFVVDFHVFVCFNSLSCKFDHISFSLSLTRSRSVRWYTSELD